MQGAQNAIELPFGVIPESNKEYVMYHGTTRDAAEDIQAFGFQQTEDGMLGRGIYLSRDLEQASRYHTWWQESDGVVIKVRVNVGRVIAIDHQDHPLQTTWHSKSYDTAWGHPRMMEGGLEMCVWDPRRIRIINVFKPEPVQR